MKIISHFFLILILNSFLHLSSFAQVNTLDFFIDQGLLKSPALNDIKNQVSSNSLDSLLVRASQKPQIIFKGSLFYAPVFNGTGYSEVITDISQVSTVFYASQRIFNRKIIESQYSKFRIMNQSLRISSKLTENDLRKAITLQYLAACKVLNDISFNEELLASSKDEETILRQLVDRGLFRQVDYLSFMVELKSQEVLLNDLKIQYEKEVTALNLICGIDTVYDRLVLPEIAVKIPSGTNSPLFARFKADSLKIANEKLISDLNYKPSVNWFSDAGILNNQPRYINKNYGFSMGLSLLVPIYDGNQRKLNAEKLNIAENTRTNYANYFRQQFKQQQQQLYSELRKTQEIIPEVTLQLEMAESVIKQDKYLINTGNISITDYVAALKNYISIRRNLNEFQVKILQIITEINYWNQ